MEQPISTRNSSVPTIVTTTMGAGSSSDQGIKQETSKEETIMNNTNSPTATEVAASVPPNYAAIDPVLQGEVYISSFKGAEDKSLLQEIGITHILTIGDTMEPQYPDHFTYLVIPIPDVEFAIIYSVFQTCFEFVDNAIKEGGRVLIHCEGGVSRSATVCIAYLMYKNPKLSVEAATRQVRKVRSFIAPNQGFLRQLSIFDELQRNPNVDDTIVKKELAKFKTDFEDRARSSSRALHQDLFSGPVDGESADNPSPKPNNTPSRGRQQNTSPKKKSPLHNVITVSNMKHTNPETQSKLPPPPLSIASQVLKGKPETGNESPTKPLPRSASNPENLTGSPSSRRPKLDQVTSPEIETCNTESVGKSIAQNSSPIIKTPINKTRPDTLVNDSISRSTSQLGCRGDASSRDALKPVLERTNPFDLITSPLAKSRDSVEGSLAGVDQLEQIVHFWINWLEVEPNPTIEQLNIPRTCQKAFAYLIEQIATFNACCPAKHEDEIQVNQEYEVERLANQTKLSARFSTLLWTKQRQCENFSSLPGSPTNKKATTTAEKQVGNKSSNSSSENQKNTSATELGDSTDEDDAVDSSQIISSLLLFASLGLHNVGDLLSDMAYYRLSELLRTSDNDYKIIGDLELDIIVELLSFTNYYILANAQESLHNSRILQLRSILESRVALMVNEDNVDTICDCLLEDPLAAQNSFRRLITYTMRFVHSCISIDMMRSRNINPPLPPHLIKRRSSRSAISPTQDDISCSSPTQCSPSSPRMFRADIQPVLTPGDEERSQVRKVPTDHECYTMRPRAQTRVERLRYHHNNVAETMNTTPLARLDTTTDAPAKSNPGRSSSLLVYSPREHTVLPDLLPNMPLIASSDQVDSDSKHKKALTWDPTNLPLQQSPLQSPLQSPRGGKLNLSTSSFLRSISPPPRLKSHGSEGTDSTAGGRAFDMYSPTGYTSVDDSCVAEGSLLSTVQGDDQDDILCGSPQARSESVGQVSEMLSNVLNIGLDVDDGSLPFPSLDLESAETMSLSAASSARSNYGLPVGSFGNNNNEALGVAPVVPATPDARMSSSAASPRSFLLHRYSPPRHPGLMTHFELGSRSYRTWHTKDKFRGKPSLDQTLIGKNMLVDPVKALQGILAHLMTSMKTKLRLHKTGIRTFKNTNKLTEKLDTLTKQAKQLPKVHPLVMVADDESRKGLSCLPKASTCLWEKIAKHSKGYGKNQTPYVFDCISKVLVVFPPSDHDTSLQLPDDTSAKFRQILRSAFELAPLGGEDALLRLTESATLSQHASAGYALTTDLNYVDRIFGTSYAEQHQLGDEMDGRNGTVTGGYLRYVEEENLEQENLVSALGCEERTNMRGCFQFTEESGHYGIRWTTLDNSYETFASFMHSSGFSDGEFLIQPYVATQPSALEALAEPDDLRQQSPVGTDDLSCRVKPMGLSLGRRVSLVSDSEWSFSDDDDN